MRWVGAGVELLLLGWFLGVGLEAIMQRANRMRSPFQLAEFHHAYLGAALVALGFHLNNVTGVLLQLLGIVITADDLYQHIEQTCGDSPTYRSPLHQLFAATVWKVPGIPAVVRILDRWWGPIAAVAALVLLTVGCASSRSLVPLVPRPDTRRIASFQMDTGVARFVVDHLARALPHEAALCLAGSLRPRHDLAVGLHVQIDSARAAAADSTDEFHVYLTGKPRSGCAGRGQLLVAHLHDHTQVPPHRACTHSDPDAVMLFGDVRLLFSLVFCQDGRGEVLFQDGRRGEFRWAPPSP